MAVHARAGRLPSSEYFRILTLRTIGNFLIFASLFMIAKTFYQPVKEEVTFYINTLLNHKYVVAGDPADRFAGSGSKGGLAKALNFDNVSILRPVDPLFSVVIPKIGANAKVIDNVDPSNEAVYLPALKKGVAHAEGTAFPGEKGSIYLFAHSTDYIWNVSTYNAVFYLLYKLEKGDEVNLFYKDKRFVYRVVDKKIVNSDAIQYLTRKTNKELLTLQTCWPPGTTLKRMLVFAQRVAE